jgi:hypothetical protein
MDTAALLGLGPYLPQFLGIANIKPSGFEPLVLRLDQGKVRILLVPAILQLINVIPPTQSGDGERVSEEVLDRFQISHRLAKYLVVDGIEGEFAFQIDGRV